MTTKQALQEILKEILHTDEEEKQSQTWDLRKEWISSFFFTFLLEYINCTGNFIVTFTDVLTMHIN
jgi:hypothetical protein